MNNLQDISKEIEKKLNEVKRIDARDTNEHYVKLRRNWQENPSQNVRDYHENDRPFIQIYQDILQKKETFQTCLNANRPFRVAIHDVEKVLQTIPKEQRLKYLSNVKAYWEMEKNFYLLYAKTDFKKYRSLYRTNAQIASENLQGITLLIEKNAANISVTPVSISLPIESNHKNTNEILWQDIELEGNVINRIQVLKDNGVIEVDEIDFQILSKYYNLLLIAQNQSNSNDINVYSNKIKEYIQFIKPKANQKDIRTFHQSFEPLRAMLDFEKHLMDIGIETIRIASSADMELYLTFMHSHSFEEYKKNTALASSPAHEFVTSMETTYNDPEEREKKFQEYRETVFKMASQLQLINRHNGQWNADASTYIIFDVANKLNIPVPQSMTEEDKKDLTQNVNTRFLESLKKDPSMISSYFFKKIPALEWVSKSNEAQIESTNPPSSYARISSGIMENAQKTKKPDTHQEELKESLTPLTQEIREKKGIIDDDMLIKLHRVMNERKVYVDDRTMPVIKYLLFQLSQHLQKQEKIIENQLMIMGEYVNRINEPNVNIEKIAKRREDLNLLINNFSSSCSLLNQLDPGNKTYNPQHLVEELHRYEAKIDEHDSHLRPQLRL